MNLPKELQEAIEIEANRHTLKNIATARHTLTERYRMRTDLSFMRNSEERCSYVVARMPATFAACRRVFLELQRQCPTEEINSILDLGAGPGTACWSASQIFPSIKQYTLMERDPELIAMGKRLAAKSETLAFRTGNWQQRHLESISSFPSHDVIICSYFVGEMPTQHLLPFVENSWKSCNQFFIVVEPGTPLGFQNILKIRNALVDLGAHIVAPCPHTASCPLAQGKQWCHFSERIERSFIHTYIKSASRSFEDEKFSYLIFSKKEAALPKARILSTPLRRSGHVNLHLCTSHGEEQKIISKKNPEMYKQARKLDWGDAWEH